MNSDNPWMRIIGKHAVWGGTFNEAMEKVVKGTFATWEVTIPALVIGEAKYKDAKGRFLFHMPGQHISTGFSTWPTTKHSIFLKR